MNRHGIRHIRPDCQQSPLRRIHKVGGGQLNDTLRLPCSDQQHRNEKAEASRHPGARRSLHGVSRTHEPHFTTITRNVIGFPSTKSEVSWSFDYGGLEAMCGDLPIVVVASDVRGLAGCKRGGRLCNPWHVAKIWARCRALWSWSKEARRTCAPRFIRRGLGRRCGAAILGRHESEGRGLRARTIQRQHFLPGHALPGANSGQGAAESAFRQVKVLKHASHR